MPTLRKRLSPFYDYRCVVQGCDELFQSELDVEVHREKAHSDDQ